MHFLSKSKGGMEKAEKAGHGMSHNWSGACKGMGECFANSRGVPDREAGEPSGLAAAKLGGGGDRREAEHPGAALWFKISASCGAACRKYTMQKFVTHETIAAGLFDESYTSGVSTYLPWAEDLRNTPEVLTLLLNRMESDYLQVRPKSRKAFTLTQLAARFTLLSSAQSQEQLQRSCAGFCACMRQFRQHFPDSYVKEETPGLMKAFLGFCTMGSALQVHVPPRGRGT